MAPPLSTAPTASPPGAARARFGMTRLKGRSRFGKSGEYAIVGVFGLLLLIAPTFAVLGALTHGFVGTPRAVFTWSNITGVFSSGYVTPIKNTLLLGAVAATICTILALVLAWILIRVPLRGQRVWSLAIVIPAAVSPLVVALSWLALFAPHAGVVNGVWQQWFGHDFANAYTLQAAIAVMVISYTPFAYLFIEGGVRNLAIDQEEAGRVHGASIRRTFIKVVVPALRDHIVVTWILTFVLAIQTFAVPALLLDPVGIPTMATAMYRAIELGQGTPNQAAALAVLLFIPGLVAAVVHTWRLRQYTSVGVGSTRVGHVHQALPRWIVWGAKIVLPLYVAVAVVVPIAALVLSSFLRFPTTVIHGSDLSLSHYATVFNDPLFGDSMQHTLLLVVGGATLGTALALVLGYIAVRGASPVTRSFSRFSSVFALAMPNFALAFGFLFFFTAVPFLRGTTSSLVTIGVLLTFTFVSLGIRLVSSGIAQLPRADEEAARVSGANVVMRFRRVLIPSLTPVLISVWRAIAIAMTIELNLVVLFYKNNSITLSVYTYLTEQGRPIGDTYAAGVMQLLFVLAVVAIVTAGEQAFRASRTRTRLRSGG